MKNESNFLIKKRKIFVFMFTKEMGKYSLVALCPYLGWVSGVGISIILASSKTFVWVLLFCPLWTGVKDIGTRFSLKV